MSRKLKVSYVFASACINNILQVKNSSGTETRGAKKKTLIANPAVLKMAFIYSILLANYE